MEATSYLKSKLIQLPDTFVHKGEDFKVASYGGNGNNAYVYWEGNKGTAIKMHYSMNKVGNDAYQGVKDVLGLEVY